MMWDSPLYAMNMFYYHWLIKKLLGPITGQEVIPSKKEESGRCHVAMMEKDYSGLGG